MPKPTPRTRPGFGLALVLVLTVFLIIGIFAFLVNVLSAGSYREVDTLSGRLRAIAVAEVGFAEIVTRLAAVPWSARWFRITPDAVFDKNAAGGSYDYILRDAPAPATTPDGLVEASLLGPCQADLMIRAYYQGSEVGLFWRLTLREDSLDSVKRVVPVFFSFAPPGSPASVATVDPLSRLVNGQLAQRTANAPAFQALRTRVLGSSTATSIQAVLGWDPGRAVLDVVVPPDGGTPRVNGDYLDSVVKSEQLGTMALLDPPPPVSVPGSGGTPGTPGSSGGTGTPSSSTPQPAPPPPPTTVGTPASDLPIPNPTSVDQFAPLNDFLGPRLAKIACFFGSAGHPDDPWMAGRASQMTDRLDLIRQQIAEQKAAAAAVPPPPPPDPAETAAFLSAMQDSVTKAYKLVYQSQDMLGYDPIGIRCP